MSQVQQFKTWGKTFSANPTAGGKTAGTYEKLGTIKIPNKSPKLFLYGFWVALVGETVTAGESGFPIIKVESSDVGLINEEFPLVKLGYTDIVATNNAALPKAAVFVPIEVMKSVNNKSFDIYVTSSATMTNDWTGYISAVFGNMPKSAIPSDYKFELFSGFKSFQSSLGRVKSDAAVAYATGFIDVALTDVVIPAKAKLLTSLMPHVHINAPTAAEEVSGLITYNAGDISDFSPQEYPCVVCYEAAIGTVVGGSKTVPAEGIPVRFPLPGTEFSFSAKFRNVIAITAGPDILNAVEFKTFEPK